MTQAAQKLPKDWQNQCTHSFFRKAYVIKEHDIPIHLCINFDQTQIIYVPGNRMTSSQTGAKQVRMVGMDEKRAFTLVVGVAADGSLLPFRLSSWAKQRHLYLQPLTHLTTMKQSMQGSSLNILEQEPIGQISKLCMPMSTIFWHLTWKKHELGLPPTQKSLVQLDV